MVDIIAQARMSSERLPGKVLKNLCDKSVLGHIITRLRQCKNIGKIIVATSTDASDNAIADECAKYGVRVFRGNRLDVLERFYMAALEYDVKDIVRVCCDNPFIDSKIIDKAAETYLNEQPCDYLNVKGTPLGIGSEIFSFYWLQKAYKNGNLDYHREHVSPFIIENALNKKIYDTGKDYSKYRLTLDTEKDWHLVTELYNRLYKGEHDFFMEDIIRCIENEPKLFNINSDVKQRRVNLCSS